MSDPAGQAPEPRSTEGRSRLAHLALNGVWWTASLALLQRVIGSISQLVAGWLLMPDDYGTVALATGVAAVSGIIRDSGISRFLVQRHGEYARLARPSFRFSLLCNAPTALLYLTAGIVMAIKREALIFIPVMASLAVALLLQTSVSVRRPELQARLDFKRIFKIDRTSLFLQHILIVGFALAQMGPLALVLPLTCCALYENIAYRRATGPLPPDTGEQGVLREVFVNVRWIMLGAAFMAISMKGDYLVIGLGFPQALAGAYYFGFTAASSFSRLFTRGLTTVLTALLARHQDAPEELRRVTIRAQSELGLLLSFLSFGLALATPATFHLFWQGKYDAAVLPALAVLIALPLRSIGPIHDSLVEATGLWRTRVVVFAIDAVGTVITAILGVQTGTMMGLCAFICGYRIIFGILLLVHTGRLLQAGHFTVLKRTLPAFALFLGLAAASWHLGGPTDEDVYSILRAVRAILIYGVGSAAILFFFYRDRALWLLRTLKRSRRAPT